MAAYRRDAVRKLASARGFLADCDGVLVDSRRSYIEAAVLTAKYVASRFLGSHIDIAPGQAKEAVALLKRTAEYNNDWDTALALILAVISSSLSGKDFLSAVSDISRLKLNELYRLQDRYLGLKNVTGYPGFPPKSFLASVFDSLYYGADDYRAVYDSEPAIPIKPGLIENEEIVVSKRTLRLLNRFYKGRAGIVTGRPKAAFRGALNKLVQEFFAARMSPDPQTRPGKPNPQLLIAAARALGAGSVVYVGDSPEDLVMSSRAKEKGLDVVFVGVYGYTTRPEEFFYWFVDHGSDIVLPSLDALPLLIQ